MDEKDLARAVAAELGGDVSADTERALTAEKTRSFGVVEAMSIGSFLVNSAQLAMAIWQTRRDRALLVEALLEKAPESKLLDPERRLGMIGRIVDRLVPESWGVSPSLGAVAEKTKQQWIKEWHASQRAADGEATRAFSRPTILQAFGDMDYYCVFDKIDWTPPAQYAGKLPAVTVPKGFVTDLASVPQIFWSVLPPQGRHGHAAILHDWLYWDQCSSRKISDDVFKAAMEELNVKPMVRSAMYSSVRVFGGSYWHSDASDKAGGERRVLAKLPDSASVTWDDWRRRPGVFA